MLSNLMNIFTSGARTAVKQVALSFHLWWKLKGGKNKKGL